MTLFLTDEEVRELTGRARKGDQVAWLRTAGIAFFVNAAGRPIVTRAQFTGAAPQAANAPAWTPAAAKGGRV